MNMKINMESEHDNDGANENENEKPATYGTGSTVGTVGNSWYRAEIIDGNCKTCILH